MSSQPPTAKKARIEEQRSDEKSQLQTHKSKVDEKKDGEDGDDEDSECEEGEIQENNSSSNAGGNGSDYLSAMEKAWILDLSQPRKQRLHTSPLQFACSQPRIIKGLWLEFGVFSGQTINLMATHAPPHTTVYGFDTFTGLPEAWRNKFDKGAFDRQGTFPLVSANVSLIKGLFQDTLKPFVEDTSKVHANDNVAVCHLDADLYSSTITVLRELKDRIVPGTLLVFDELINYPEYRQHEWLALRECVEDYGWEFEWLAQSALLEALPVLDIWDTQQVAVRITHVKAAPSSADDAAPALSTSSKSSS